MRSLKEGGVSRLYRGYMATMVGVVPYAGFSFYSYETLKKRHTHSGTPPSTPLLVVFGAVSGVLGQSSSYPFDIVRRRLQVGGSSSVGGSIVGMMKHIARTEGLIKGLYKGLSMNWIKGPIAAGISFSSFDFFKTLFRSQL